MLQCGAEFMYMGGGLQVERLEKPLHVAACNIFDD